MSLLYISIIKKKQTQEPSNMQNFFFFKLGFTPCKAEQILRGMDGLTRKRSTKRLEHTENVHPNVFDVHKFNKQKVHIKMKLAKT